MDETAEKRIWRISANSLRDKFVPPRVIIIYSSLSICGLILAIFMRFLEPSGQLKSNVQYNNKNIITGLIEVPERTALSRTREIEDTVKAQDKTPCAMRSGVPSGRGLP